MAAGTARKRSGGHRLFRELVFPTGKAPWSFAGSHCVTKLLRVAGAGFVAGLVSVVAACGVDADTPVSATHPTSSSDPSSKAGLTGSPDGSTTAADVFGPACSRLPHGYMSAMSVMATNPLLARFVAAVKDARLVDLLDNRRAITVFAPADPAVMALGEKHLADLTVILKNHVLGKRYDAKGLAVAGSVTSLNADGEPLKIESFGENMTISGAKILCGNIPAANATVFIVDKVLTPHDSA